MAASTEHVVGVPHPRLRAFVDEYTGYRMSGLSPGVHAGLPSRSLTMIIAFDDPIDVTSGHDERERASYWAMVGGLHSRPAEVRHDGRQHGVQLRLTPLGATALLATPAGELATAVVDLGDVVPDYSDELVERLTFAPSWRARWAALDDVLVRHVCEARPHAAEVEQAWAILTSSHGAVSVGDLAAHVGWSRRHLSQQFSRSFGLSPKTMARVLRFERAQQMLRLPTRPSLASVAHACGYADQAHMTRDWNEFAGSPPTEWMADEILPFVQDADADDASR